ncbi:MAG: hypothetical protein ABFC96_18830 [Thermoguttaceae bacterium]
MKRLLGILVGVVVVTAAIAVAQQRNDGFAQRPAPAGPTAAAAGAELIVVPMPSADKGQILTIVDPQQRALGVYHIDAATGKIALKSVRNIHWDLQIRDLNNDKPLPQEIQSLLETR